jgi:predicted lipopolysaccharide heptosyltransferase III
VNRDYHGILLFKLRYIGDVLLTTPAVRLVRRSFPQAHITIVVNQGTEDVFRHNPHVTRVLTVDRAGWCNQLRLRRALRKQKYEVSVDFASGDRAAWLSLLSGVPLRVGLATPKGLRRLIHNRQLPIPQPMIHAVDLYLALAREAFDVETTDKALELHTGTDDEQFAASLLEKQRLAGRPFVALHVGGRYPFNRWPLENWARLAEVLPWPAVFVGGAQDVSDVNTVLAQTKARTVSLAGQTTVLQLAALLRQAAVFVGNDSGPMHIAAAMGTRVVALFGSSDPVAWGPWGDGHVVIQCGSNQPMANIKVETVLAAVPKAART